MKKHLIIVLLMLVFLPGCSPQAAPSESVPEETAPSETVTAEKTENEPETGNETVIDPYALTGEQMIDDMEKYQKGNLVFYVPKALGMHTDEEADIPENQFFLTGDYMGMIVGQVGEHDGLIEGGITEAMLNDQQGLVAMLTPPGTIEEINGRYFSYGVMNSEDVNYIDIWTVIPDKYCLYLIMIRTAEEDWELFHEVIPAMIGRMEVSGSD